MSFTFVKNLVIKPVSWDRKKIDFNFKFR
jgi:hypothetical protein